MPCSRQVTACLREVASQGHHVEGRPAGGGNTTLWDLLKTRGDNGRSGNWEDAGTGHINKDRWCARNRCFSRAGNTGNWFQAHKRREEAGAKGRNSDSNWRKACHGARRGYIHDDGWPTTRRWHTNYEGLTA